MFTMFTGFLPLGETVEWEAFFASHKLQKKKKKAHSNKSERQPRQLDV